MTTPHDFPEDFYHENGMYQNRCIACRTLFLGYKRRRLCKICDKLQPDADDERLNRIRREVYCPLFDKETQFEVAIGTIAHKERVIENLRLQIENLRILLSERGVFVEEVDSRQYEHLKEKE